MSFHLPSSGGPTHSGFASIRPLSLGSWLTFEPELMFIYKCISLCILALFLPSLVMKRRTYCIVKATIMNVYFWRALERKILLLLFLFVFFWSRRPGIMTRVMARDELSVTIYCLFALSQLALFQFSSTCISQ